MTLLENAFTINTKDYKNWVGFAHDFCKGCVYEMSSSVNEDKRIRECCSCRDDVLDVHYYRERRLLMIARDEKGKNIAKIIEE